MWVRSGVGQGGLKLLFENLERGGAGCGLQVAGGINQKSKLDPVLLN